MENIFGSYSSSSTLLVLLSGIVGPIMEALSETKFIVFIMFIAEKSILIVTLKILQTKWDCRSSIK